MSYAQMAIDIKSQGFTEQPLGFWLTSLHRPQSPPILGDFEISIPSELGGWGDILHLHSATPRCLRSPLS